MHVLCVFFLWYISRPSRSNSHAFFDRKMGTGTIPLQNPLNGNTLSRGLLPYPPTTIIVLRKILRFTLYLTTSILYFIDSLMPIVKNWKFYGSWNSLDHNHGIMGFDDPKIEDHGFCQIIITRLSIIRYHIHAFMVSDLQISKIRITGKN